MIDVSQAIKSLYRSDVIPHTIRFSIGNTNYTETDILNGSLSIQESICSKDTLEYNSVEASKLEVTLAKETGNVKELTGKQLTIYADVSGTSIPLGVYTIKEAKLDGDYFTKITAYNRMQVFLDTVIDNWWNQDLVFPLTLRQLLIALCTYLNIPYSLPATWTNSGIAIGQNTYFENVKASELLGYIQEASGSFFVVDRTGILKILEPSDETTLFTYEMLLNDPEISDFEVPSIEKLWVHASNDDVGVTVGTGSNTYTITANPLLFNFGTSELTAIAERILTSIARVGYTPFKAAVKCQPYLEVGDPVTVRTYKGNQASFMLMTRKMSDVGLLNDAIEIKGEATIKQRTSTAKQMKVLNRRMHEVVNTIEEFGSTIEQVESDVAKSASSYEYYYLNNDGTRPAVNDPNWSSTSSWVDGQHCWRKTVIVHNNGTKTLGSIEDITGSTGATGKDGEKGAAGVGITKAVFQYILSTSDSVIETKELYPAETLYPDNYILPRQIINTEWQYTKPFVPGYYLWSRLEVTYDDGTVKYTVPVLEGAFDDIYSSIVANRTDIIQNKEQIGLKANQSYVIEQVNQIEGQIQEEKIERSAEISVTAQSIKSEVYQSIYVRPIREYNVYLQNDGEIPDVDSSDWSEDAPVWMDGKHVWMMHVTEFSNGLESSFSYGSPVDITGNSGTSVSIVEKRIKYQYSSSGTAVPSGSWSDNIPEVPKGNYLWTWTYIKYSDSNETSAYSVSYVPNDGMPGAKGDKGDKGDTGPQGAQGEQGIQGEKGNAGDDGNGISSILYYYKTTTTQNAPEASSITSTSIPVLDSTNKYLWQKEVITYTKATAKTTVLLLAVYGDRGIQGEQGVQGNAGEDGNGIQSITYHYATSTAQTAPSASSITSTTIPTLTATDKYLWQKETIKYTKSGVADKVTVLLLAVYGDQGIQGETGNGIKSWKVEYKSGTSATVPPSGTYSEEIPVIAPGNYLWTRITYTYDDDTTMTSYSVSYKAGQTQTVQNQYYLSASDKEVGVLAPLKPSDDLYPKDYLFPVVETSTTNKWTDDQPDNVPGFYMWMRQKITMDDGTVIYTSPTLDKGYSELYAYHLEEKAGIEETNNTVSAYAENLRTLQTDVAVIKSQDIANINISIGEIRSEVSSSYERVQQDFVSKQELGTSLEQTKSEVKAEVWETSEGKRIASATANLDKDGLHVSTENDDTELNATGAGILVTKDENGNKVVVVKFTKDDSIANYLEIQKYLTFGAHRWETRIDTEWDGTESLGSAALWKGAD